MSQPQIGTDTADVGVARLRRSRFFRAVAAFTLTVFVASCATTKLPPISDSGAGFQPEDDEVKLWAQAREEEQKLRQKMRIYEDPLLGDYLEDVVDRLEPTGMAENTQLDYRVSVVEDPTLNAFAFPHGSLYVHTGLLARMENEDQLATVIGHEMTHVENRHMLRHQRSQRNKMIGFSVAAVAGAVILAGEQGDAAKQGQYGKAARIGVLADVMIGLGLALAFMASVSGYGRKLEREADQGGFEKMSMSGYDIRESPKVYAALKDDHGESGKFETFFFGSHPRLTERIEAAELWASEHPDAIHASQAGDQEGFRRRMRPILRTDARLNLEMGRYQLAADQLRRVLDETPGDALALSLMGQVKVKQAEQSETDAERDALRAEARDLLRRAVEIRPDQPEAHRELGLLAYRVDDFAGACIAFRKYLELSPSASDAQTYRDYILELEQDGHCP